ncbi:MAG: hypothetical protein AAB432_01980 [Patescibacteria group bacterium]
MKTRTLSKRNWLGGFLCGLIGILTIGYLHGALAPVGGFIGFLVGFRYEEIISGAGAYWRISIKRIDNTWQRFVVFVTTPTRKLKRAHINIDFSPLLKFIHFLLFVLTWILMRPIAIYHWLKRHPMNRAYVILAFAVVAYFVLQFLWIIPFAQNMSARHELFLQSVAPADYERVHDNGTEGLVMIVILGGLFPIFAGVIFSLTSIDYKISEMRLYYKRFECYMNHGGFYFFLQSLWRMICMEFFGALLELSMLLYWIAGGALLIAFVFAPVSAIVGSFRGFWKIMARNDYWPGLIISTVVMLAVGLLTHQYLQGTVLWIVALATGTICGSSAVAAQRALISYYVIRPRLQAMVRLRTSRYLLPTGRSFVKFSGRLNDVIFSFAPKPV